MPPAPEPAPLPVATPDPDFPLAAKLNRGVWYYQLTLGGAQGLHGPRTRWYPETKFSAEELESFAYLREVAAGATKATALPVATAASKGRLRAASSRFEPPRRCLPLRPINTRRDARAPGRLYKKPRPKGGSFPNPHGTEPPPDFYYA